MRRVMHKRTKEGGIMQKISRNHSLEAKREEKTEWGSSKMRRPGFLKPVGSPSGLLINPSGCALPSKYAISCAHPDV
jgi:hypothetical protein